MSCQKLQTLMHVWPWHSSYSQELTDTHIVRKIGPFLSFTKSVMSLFYA